MIDQSREAMGLMVILHDIVRKILSGDSNVSEKEVYFAREYVKKFGLDGIFKTPEEMYPKHEDFFGTDDLLKGALSLGDDSDVEDVDEDLDDEDEMFFGDNRIIKKLDAGQYVDVDEFSFSQYFMRMLKKVKSIEELDFVLEKSLALEPFYKDCPNEAISNKLAYFIGDLCFVMGRYDEALERYTQIYEAYRNANTSLRGSGLIEILNVYYKAKKQPPPEMMLKCGCRANYVGELIDESGDYLKRRFMVERAKHGDDFFEWAMSQGNDWGHYTHGVFDYMFGSRADQIRKRLGLKPFLYFTMMKAVASFAEVVYAEAKLILKLQGEFKKKDFLVDKWCEKLEWLEAFQVALPDEEIVFCFHTPWTWKFSFDLFFPRRQMAIMFHLPDEYDASVFKYEMAGKLQHMKEWSRVVAKSGKSYGIRLSYVPMTHDKSDLSQLLKSCEAGLFPVGRK